jgi:hypothetical protein
MNKKVQTAGLPALVGFKIRLLDKEVGEKIAQVRDIFRTGWSNGNVHNRHSTSPLSSPHRERMF